jgi:hypothetical protein
MDQSVGADFLTQVSDALAEGATLQQFAQLLRVHAAQGLTQDHALHLLEQLRARANPAAEERLLEYLDVASGFCREELRVWL